jgi:hypothetical protein
MRIVYSRMVLYVRSGLIVHTDAVNDPSSGWRVPPGAMVLLAWRDANKGDSQSRPKSALRQVLLEGFHDQQRASERPDSVPRSVVLHVASSGENDGQFPLVARPSGLKIDLHPPTTWRSRENGS